MATTTYRVSNWTEFFEKNHKESEVVYRWVAVPTKHDGKGFRRLAAHERAVEVFCAWNLILQVAAKMPTRGLLADESGPLDAEDLADSTGFPAAIFEIAFEVLTDPRVGWLETVPSPDKSGLVPDKFRLQDRTGQNRTGQNKGHAAHASAEPTQKPSAAAADRPTALFGGGGGEVEKPGSRVLLTFPVKVAGKGKNAGKAEWHLRESKLAEYAQSYPELDVLPQFRRACQWARDNRNKRATFGGMPAFLTRWLNRALDKPRPHRDSNEAFDDSPEAQAKKALEIYERRKEAARNGAAK